jgi:hypothetical protein
MATGQMAVHLPLISVAECADRAQIGWNDDVIWKLFSRVLITNGSDTSTHFFLVIVRMQCYMWDMLDVCHTSHVRNPLLTYIGRSVHARNLKLSYLFILKILMCGFEETLIPISVRFPPLSAQAALLFGCCSTWEMSGTQGAYWVTVWLYC